MPQRLVIRLAIEKGGMMKKRKSEPTSWVVIAKCVITREIVCDDCTQQEAENDPFSFASDERELDQEDWEVMSVEPNE